MKEMFSFKGFTTDEKYTLGAIEDDKFNRGSQGGQNELLTF